ncbi:MAG: chemotaxis response regulator protein-glutamate methylesterase [Bacteriovorax sp.]|nr:chemotaxis response regulator protein-glutamate methylesterase [Bacteriovorax sp.]
MNKMNSKDLVTKISGGEYLVELVFGDVFVSLHPSDGNCLGFYLKKNDITKEILDSVFTKMTAYLSLSELMRAEVKMIGKMSSIKLVADFFALNKIYTIKEIEKGTAVEVMFLPLLNKVRVSKDVPQALAPKMTKNKYKILIVDDSKTIRNILSRIFSSDPGLEVCAMAEKPSEVEALILKHKPDVITLDIHMPEMDGVALLKIIAPKYNIPTVMISSISMAEGPMVLEALESGAIDYIQKPELSEIEKVTPFIVEKVRTAAKANLAKPTHRKNSKPVQTKAFCDLSSLIVLGSSTGGTEAIREIITALPDKIPPMLIVQHIPAVFSAAFAKRMNDLCPFEVKEAENGDEVRANRILIAPGGQQMKLIYKNGKASVEVNDDEPVNRFKPSVDYMFLSVAKNIYTHTIAIILTGMGKDGARGMLELRNQGVRTIAQDEYSSVVFGMPKEAIALGGAEFVEPLSEIAEKITLLTKDRSHVKKSS